MKQKLQDIISLLINIERTYAAQRAAQISSLQNKIWEEPTIENEDINYMLTILAGDLNFYEPIEHEREEELGYYGDEKLLKLISNARVQIENYVLANAVR